MKMQFAILLLVVSQPVVAADWSGHLVDAKCYAAEERNVNPFDTAPAARDMQYEVRYCAPRAKTGEFAVVTDNWSFLWLDAAGNAKAAELVKQAGKKLFRVHIKGERNKDNLTVTAISVEAPGTRSTTSSHPKIAHE